MSKIASDESGSEASRWGAWHEKWFSPASFARLLCFVRQRLYSCHQRWDSARRLTVFLQWGHWQTVNTGQFFAHSVHGFIFTFICTIMFTYGSVHTTPEKFENAALFLRLGLPSTLIRHENGAFRKRSSIRRNLKTPAFRFSVDGKHFKNGASRKRWRFDISLPEFSSNTKLK